MGSSSNSEDWSPVAAAIADFCGAANTAFVTVDSPSGFSRVATPRADPDVVARYGAYWWQFDPTAAATASVTPGQLTGLSLTGRDLFYGSRFYNEFWIGSGLGAERLATNLHVEDGAFASIVLHASCRSDEIDDEMRLRFSLLTPHLIRGLGAARRLRMLENALSGMMRRTEQGLVVVGGDARVLFVEDRALSLLASLKMMRISAGRIAMLEPRLQTALDRGIAEAGRAPRTARVGETIRFDDTEGEVTVEILPCDARLGRSGALSAFSTGSARALLLITHSKAARTAYLGVLRERFGLTPAEARLADEIRVGDGREAAARRCGISVHTARTHLSRIFEKVGVKRQSELIHRSGELGL